MSYTNPIIETSDWKAKADLRPPGPFKLRVTGKVKLRSGDYQVELKQKAPDGDDIRSVLYLRIVIQGDGATEDISEKDVSFELDGYQKDQYDNVEILATTERLDEIEEFS